MHRPFDVSTAAFKCATFDREPSKCELARVGKAPCLYTEGRCRKTIAASRQACRPFVSYLSNSVPHLPLQCSESVWPLLTSAPNATGPANQEAHRQCDARSNDLMPGNWSKDSRGWPSAYITALHNKTAWSAVEGGRSAHGKHGHASRCKCFMGDCNSNKVEQWTFTPHTGCRRLTVHEGMARLRKRPLTILGDSVAMQSWSALAAVNAASTSSQQHWPKGLAWFCIPETAEQLGTLLRHAGLWRDIADDSVDDVLIVSFGAWYNVDLRHVCNKTHHWNTTTDMELKSCFKAYEARIEPDQAETPSTCEQVVGLDDELPPALTESPEWTRAAEVCTSKQFTVTKDHPDPCMKGRGDLCRSIAERAEPGLTQCVFAKDSARLATFLTIHRAHLPKHVFVLDLPPVHGKAIFNGDNGRWRTRTRAIWQQMAPWVTLLPASEMLVPHGKAKLDFMHWCIDTAQFEEYISSVLTAIVSVIGV